MKQKSCGIQQCEFASFLCVEQRKPANFRNERDYVEDGLMLEFRMKGKAAMRLVCSEMI